MATIGRHTMDIKQGYLTKSPDLDKHKGPKSSFMTWKKRWFVFRNVQENPTLAYYADQKTFQKEKKRPNGIIELSKCEAIEGKPEVEVQKHRYENVICITVSSSPKKPHGKRLYYLLADSRADMEDWYRKIQDVLVELKMMEQVEGDGLVRSNTATADMKKYQPKISTRQNYRSAPTGTLEEQFNKRRSNGSTDSADSFSDHQSDTNSDTPAQGVLSPDQQNAIVSTDVEERVRCCQKRHVIQYNKDGNNIADLDVIYENIHFIRNQLHWEKDVMQRKEKMAQVEEDYQDFSVIKTLQNENICQGEEQRKKPPPPPRTDSLPDQPEVTGGRETDTMTEEQSEAAAAASKQHGRRRKLSTNMYNHLSPEVLANIIPEQNIPNSPKVRDRRNGSVVPPVALQNSSTADVRHNSRHSDSSPSSSFPFPPSRSMTDPFDEPPPYDIPPVPVPEKNTKTRKLSQQEMLNRPLPNPGEGTLSSNLYSQESEDTSPTDKPALRTRKLSRQELVTRPLPNPPGGPTLPGNGSLPPPPMGNPGRDSDLFDDDSPYLDYNPAELPCRPPPPPPPVRRSNYASMSAMQNSQEAILINPCKVSSSAQKMKRRSRSGSMPNLLDDDEFNTFRQLHPEVLARIPQEQEANLYSQDPNYFKPKIPESRSSKKERKLSFDMLDSEMKQTEGMTRTILREYLAGKSVALVGIVNSVWVAGWKSDIQSLQNTFHVGDQILAINDKAVESVAEAYDAIERSPSVVKVQFRRMPLGQMFAMNRHHPDEDWGIVVKSMSTGIAVHSEIDQVFIQGLAYASGLKPKCRSISDRLSNWAITEINFEPISLFASTQKVKKQLQDIGLDIVILVQPCDFIKELKRQLQETKNWYAYAFNPS